MAGYDSFEGWRAPKTGSDSFEGWHVPEENQPVRKTIQWANNRWECEPFIVELFQEVEGERVPVNIDPKTVNISDTRDWLEKDGDSIRGADKKWQVPVRIRQEKLKELVPEGYNELYWQSPDFRTGKLPENQDAPPQKKLTTTLTVTVEVVSRAEATAGAAMEAASGMNVGFGGIVSKGIPKIRVDSQPVEYEVLPPRPHWTPEQQKPLVLSGKGLEETVTLTLDRLPEGWDTGLTVTCALPEKASENMGLTLSIKDNVPDAAKGITSIHDGSVSLNDPMAPTAFTGSMKPDVISATIRLVNAKLCLNRNSEISENPETYLFPIAVSTKSEYLGSSCHWAPAVIQPVEVAIYFEKEPAFNYFKLDEKRYIRVIRQDTQRNSVPRRSKLAVSLESTKDAGISPRIQWNREETTMDDEFISPAEIKTTYKAPTQDSWERQDEPPTVIVRCLAGPEDEETVIEDAPGEMYSTALIESYIVLKKPLGFAKINCKLSPSGLPPAAQMDLINKDILENFHREFSILIDLQKIADESGGE
jgi:hypothetical protein